MIFKLGDKEVEVFFLTQKHFDLLKFHGLELSALPTLPACKDVTDEDSLEWLRYQRGMEKQLCGFSTTTYTGAGALSIDNLKLRGIVFTTKYQELLNLDSSLNLSGKNYFHCFNGKLFILSSNNTVSDLFFKYASGNIYNALYKALLLSYGYFEIYHRDYKDLDKSVSERKFIDTGFLLKKILS